MTELLNVDELRDENKDKYAAVVLTPSATFHFHTGCQLTERLGYDTGPVDDMPDVVLAAMAAEPDGNVIGVDMTADMLTKATAAADRIGIDNVEFREGHLAP